MHISIIFSSTALRNKILVNTSLFFDILKDNFPCTGLFRFLKLVFDLLKLQIQKPSSSLSLLIHITKSFLLVFQ